MSDPFKPTSDLESQESDKLQFPECQVAISANDMHLTEQLFNGTI